MCWQDVGKALKKQALFPPTVLARPFANQAQGLLLNLTSASTWHLTFI